ncbi:MAG: hypothetical protein Pars2KO_25030 [Parasphingorhabdus sp.]
MRLCFQSLASLLAMSAVSPQLVQAEATPERFSVLVTYGADECPEAEGDEIVVCANRPESERYRIPKELRQQREDERAISHSWASTVELHDEASRVERPNSCSVVGTNGFSGCQQALIRRWFAEQREKDNETAD